MTEWTFPAWIGLACLYVVTVLCILGLVSKHYRENWFQTVGLIGLCLWALGRSSVLLDRMESGKLEIGAYQFLSHVSLVLFGLGTAWKVWKHRGKQ